MKEPIHRPPKISLLEARKWALAELTAAGIDQEQATDQIDFLLTGALQVNYGMLRANLTRQMHPWLADHWPGWVAKLIQGWPAQYVLGQAPFYGREFLVDQRVLIPRPETELLVDWVLTDLKVTHQQGAVGQDPVHLLDVGTGSGAIILTLAQEIPGLIGTGLDISKSALAVAAKNRARFALTDRVHLVESDLFAAVSDQRFDLIVANPPYIRPDGQDEMDQSVVNYEPDLALYAPNDGLAIYQRLAQDLSKQLQPGGQAYFEIGYDQGPTLMALFQAALPTAEVTLKQDLSGLDRLIRVRLKNENERFTK